MAEVDESRSLATNNIRGVVGSGDEPNKNVCQSELENFFYRGIQEKKIFSQNGEDGVIEALLDKFGSMEPALKYYVEFGTQQVIPYLKGEINTRVLREQRNYTGLLMDGDWQNEEANQHKHKITADNIVGLFQTYQVPREFNLLSIDLDFDDYWVWQAIPNKDYRPRVVIIEYNSKLGLDDSRVVNLKDLRRWKGTDYFGASWQAMKQLGQAKGYTLVFAERMGVNLFFVRTDLLNCPGLVLDDTVLYRPPRYGANRKGHRTETNPDRKWVLNPDPYIMPSNIYPPPVVLPPPLAKGLAISK